MAYEIEQELSSSTSLVPAGTTGFDYSAIAPEVADAQRERAIRILGLSRRGLELTAEIGRELLAAQKELEHGQFLPWVEGALGLSKSTAYRAMDVAERFGPDQLPAVQKLPLEVVYKLAARSTPEEVRSSVLRRISEGEAVKGEVVLEEVRTAVEDAKKKAAGERKAARLAKLKPEEQAGAKAKAKAKERRQADRERKDAEARREGDEKRRFELAETAAAAEILVDALGPDAAAQFVQRFGGLFLSVMPATANLAGVRRAATEPVTTMRLDQIDRTGRLNQWHINNDDQERAQVIAADIGFEGQAPALTVSPDPRRPTIFNLASDVATFLALADVLKRTEVEVRIVPPLPTPSKDGEPKAKGRGKKICRGARSARASRCLSGCRRRCPAMEFDGGWFYFALTRHPSRRMGLPNDWADEVLTSMIADVLGAGRDCDADDP